MTDKAVSNLAAYHSAHGPLRIHPLTVKVRCYNKFHRIHVTKRGALVLLDHDRTDGSVDPMEIADTLSGTVCRCKQVRKIWKNFNPYVNEIYDLPKPLLELRRFLYVRASTRTREADHRYDQSMDSGHFLGPRGICTATVFNKEALVVRAFRRSFDRNYTHDRSNCVCTFRAHLLHDYRISTYGKKMRSSNVARDLINVLDAAYMRPIQGQSSDRIGINCYGYSLKLHADWYTRIGKKGLDCVDGAMILEIPEPETVDFDCTHELPCVALSHYRFTPVLNDNSCRAVLVPNKASSSGYRLVWQPWSYRKIKSNGQEKPVQAEVSQPDQPQLQPVPVVR